MTTKRKNVFWLLVLLCGLLVYPAGISAHAALDRAEPAANAVLAESPEQVTIWFTEPLEPQLSEIVVFNAAGEQVDNGDTQVDEADPTVMRVTLPPLPEGSYTVSWKNVSTVDGHPVSGSYVFSVGEATAGPAATTVAAEDTPLPTVEAVVRWLVLVGILAVAGGLSFLLWVLRPALNRAAPEAGRAALAATLTGRVVRLMWAGMVLFVLASVAQLLWQLYRAELFNAGALTFIGGAYWGRMWVLRMVLAVVLALVLPRPGASPAARQPSRDLLALLLAAATLLTLSLVSHAAATAGIEAPAVITDYLHLLAAGVWVGGLFHFLAVMPLVFRQLHGEERQTFLATLTPYFSALAIVCVAALALTGIISTYAQVTVPVALRTPYGSALLVKLALIVPLLLLGAMNLVLYSPRLKREPAAGERLRNSVRLEVLLAGLLLLAVGFLTSLEPARQVATRLGLGGPPALRLEEDSEGATIILTVEPGQAGNNRVAVSLADRQGRLLNNARDVLLTPNLPAEGLSPPVGRPEKNDEGQFIFNDVPLTVAGEWQLAVRVVRSNAFDAEATFDLDIPPAGSGSTNVTIFPVAARVILLLVVSLVLLAGLLVGVWVWRARVA